MIKPIAVSILVMSTMASGAFAFPVLYTLSFTATTGPAPTAGSFNYDAAAPFASRFTNFNVVWENAIFDLTAAANTNEQFVGTDCGTTASSQSVFTILSGQSVCANPALIAWDGGRPGGIVTFDFRNQELSGSGPPKASIAINASTPFSEGPDASGTFSISSAPEPSTLVLSLLAGAYMLRRRVAPRASPR